jgi:hypothetical protein
MFKVGISGGKKKTGPSPSMTTAASNRPKAHAPDSRAIVTKSTMTLTVGYISFLKKGVLTDRRTIFSR